MTEPPDFNTRIRLGKKTSRSVKQTLCAQILFHFGAIRTAYSLTFKKIHKSHFSTLLFIYFRLFTLAQKKTSSNYFSAAVAVYLLLFSTSYYLHSPSTASGARYRRSACIDMDVLRLAAAACCDMG